MHNVNNQMRGQMEDMMELSRECEEEVMDIPTERK